MPKIRKLKKKKKFLTTLNRKRMRNKQRNTGSIRCAPIKNAWDTRKSVAKNLTDMGLAHDPNKVIGIPNHKQEETKKAISIIKHQYIVTEEPDVKPSLPPMKPNVLEKIVERVEAPRKRKFMLPKGQVEFITYLLDKYGHDYKAMTRDKKNHYQETWRQLRAKVKTFMGIPQQYAKYLEERGLLDQDIDESMLKKEAEAFAMADSD